eukprot:3395312-Rhodomonas_salina.1
MSGTDLACGVCYCQVGNGVQLRCDVHYGLRCVGACGVQYCSTLLHALHGTEMGGHTRLHHTHLDRYVRASVHAVRGTERPGRGRSGLGQGAATFCVPQSSAFPTCLAKYPGTLSAPPCCESARFRPTLCAD